MASLLPVSVLDRQYRSSEMVPTAGTLVPTSARQGLKATRPQKPVGTPSILDGTRTDLARVRVLCRAWAANLPKSQQSDSAALFAQHALNCLAEQSASDIDRHLWFLRSKGQLDHSTSELAAEVGRLAAALPIVDALHVVTSLYPMLLSARDRSRLGAFYTPPALTSRLLDQAEESGVNWATARVLDPAAGGGAFLVQIAQRMINALGDCDPAFVLKQLGSRLVGLELDPNAAELGQRALDVLLAGVAQSSGLAVPQMTRVCDTLDLSANASFDLVIGNPPYGRVTLTPVLRRKYARSLYGHANLYGVFTDAALRWTKPSGLIAYLTPTSFLGGQYYAALRGLLAEEAPPVAIDFVHARSGVFEDVQQETLLAVYKKGASAVRARVHYLHVVNEREATVQTNGTVGLPLDPRAPWLAPRNPEHSELIASVESMTSRLSDWGYDVSTGPLVWNRFKDQLREKLTGRDVYPLIWAESVTAEGRFLFRADKRNHVPYFKLTAADQWLLVSKPCVLVQRTTAKEQARRLIAAELPRSFIARHKGVVVENHLNMIYAESPAAVGPAVVAALLNSDVVDQVFRCINGSVAVSAFELEAIPLPQVSDLVELTRLVKAGAGREQIEAECDRLYGRARA